MRHLSPLRYPGGKAGLSGLLTEVIELNDLTGSPYFEPYAGGAGAALSLLKVGAVSEIFLNDADPRVYAFWHSALMMSERFVDHIRTAPICIAEWKRQSLICEHPTAHSLFDLGFAAFYMNRCNRSGVMTGSGPIGGYEQSGPWRLGVRFNRDALAERVLALARLRGRIHLSCEDAVAFLKRRLPRGPKRRRVLVYLDPPYVANGQRLYLNAYRPPDHAFLAKYLRGQKSLPWIMSYDDCALVRQLYNDQFMAILPIRYTLQAKRSASELLIAPKSVHVPRAATVHGRESMLHQIHFEGSQP